jgi:DNA-directed RNA polymerase subunit F
MKVKKELERLHTKSLNKKYITFGEFKRFVKSIEKEQAKEFQKKIDEFKMKVEDIISIYMKDGLDIDRSFFDEMYDCLNKIFSEEGEGK